MKRALPLLLVLIALLMAGCGDDEDSSDASGGSETAAETTTADAGCEEVAAPPAKEDGGAKKPSQPLDPKATYTVRMRTSCGTFVIEVDQRTAPNTAASFVSLARDGFYDRTTFHRIVPGFVIQGGDPTGTGTGGPGYSVRDVPPPDAAYTKGVVAMAKTGSDPPGTSGSQFYVVTAPDAGLPPEYALLGEVVEGMDVVRRIEGLGDPASGELGTPTQPVTIEEAEVVES